MLGKSVARMRSYSSNSQITKTFQNQQSLPRVPIPAIEDTVSRYIRSVKPLQSDQEHENTKKLAQEFIAAQGLGHKLQQRLVEYDRTQSNSWLEKWWLELAYHSWRESSMVNSNWYMLLDNHPKHPAELLGNGTLWKRNGAFTEFQLKRAGNLIKLLLDYLEELKDEKIPPETTRQGPLCMNQYRYLFGVTRVPQDGCDKIVYGFPPKSQHITVLVRDQVYVLEVSEAGKMLNAQELFHQLQRITKDAQNLKKSQAPIPLLTSEHRDNWSKAYAHLESFAANKKNFDMIQSALFSVCLDDISLPATVDAFAERTISGINGHNRWFDSCLSMILHNDGRVSVNGEHSPLDALIPAFLFNTIISRENPDFPEQPVRTLLAKPFRLEWKVDETIEKALTAAEANAVQISSGSDLKIVEFHGFGAEFIKKLKVSPDAFVQMSLQLAFYRIHKCLTAIYETASTRKYLHGRTETTRSLSNESASFVKGFDSPALPKKEKYESFKQACQAHVDYVRAASDGNGCDRHLLGLAMCLKNGETCELFKDPVFNQSRNFRLSTSNLFPGEHLVGTGFGAVASDGYGMNYMIHSDHIRIGIESKKACKDTSSTVFAETLASVWMEMQEQFNEYADLQSKL